MNIENDTKRSGLLGSLWTFAVKHHPALSERNVRLYMPSQFVSFSGNWGQTLAIQWIVLGLTAHKTSAEQVSEVAFITALTQLPAFLSSLGGIIADHFEKKNLLYMLQFISMAQALLLGTLTVIGTISLPWLYALSCVLGFINAVEMPTRAALVREMVEVKHITSAANLNSGMIHLSRTLGPAIAGLVISAFGIATAFFVNAISYTFTIMNLKKIRLHEVTTSGLKPGIIRYMLGSRRIMVCIATAGLTGFACMSYQSLLPSMSKDVFGGGPQTNGMLLLVISLGAVTGTVFLSPIASRIGLGRFLTVGAVTASIGMFALSRASTTLQSFPGLFLAGMGFANSFTSLRAVFQKDVDRRMLGRIIGIMMSIFMVATATGNTLNGMLAGKIGIMNAVFWNGVAAGILAIIVGIFKKEFDEVEESAVTAVSETAASREAAQSST